MMRPLPLSPAALIALHKTAAAWFMRRDAAGWTGADERALNHWLAADPLHREIFDDMARTSQDLHRLPLARHRSWSATPPAPPVPMAAPSATAVLGRRQLVPALGAACLLLALGGGVGWQRWDQTPRHSLDLATARGEVRQVELPDGSRVTLNFDTRLQVRYYAGRRELQLHGGEAFFEVTADAARPFTVDSGRSRVTVVGTAFNVRAAPHELVVKVLHGRVALRPDRASGVAPVLAMGAGTGISIDAASGLHRSVPAGADMVGDWRGGQLHFQRTPLAEVAQELSRYLGRPILLASPRLAQQPVSGVAATATPEAFLQALPDLLPLRLQRQPDGGWRIFER